MVHLEALAKRARRAAEWGRLRSASRVALAVVPFTLLALAVSPNRAAIVGIAVALLAATVGLGWLNAEGVRETAAAKKPARLDYVQAASVPLVG